MKRHMKLLLVVWVVSVTCFSEEELFAAMKRQSQSMKSAGERVSAKVQKDAMFERVSRPSSHDGPMSPTLNSFRHGSPLSDDSQVVSPSTLRKVLRKDTSLGAKKSKRSKIVVSPPGCKKDQIKQALVSYFQPIYSNFTLRDQAVQSSLQNLSSMISSGLSNVTFELEQKLRQSFVHINSSCLSLTKQASALHAQKVGYLGNLHLKIGTNLTRVMRYEEWTNQSLAALERGQSHVLFTLNRHSQWFKGNVSHISRGLEALQPLILRNNSVSLATVAMLDEMHELSRNLSRFESAVGVMDQRLIKDALDVQELVTAVGSHQRTLTDNLTLLSHSLSLVMDALTQVSEVQAATVPKLSSMSSTVSSIIREELENIYQQKEENLISRFDNAMKPFNEYLESEKEGAEACYTEIQCKNWCVATMECEEDCNLLQIGNIVTTLDEMHKLRNVMRCENYLPELILVTSISVVLILILSLLTLIACLCPCCSFGKTQKKSSRSEYEMSTFPMLSLNPSAAPFPSSNPGLPLKSTNPFMTDGEEKVADKVDAREDEPPKEVVPDVNDGAGSVSQPGESGQAQEIKKKSD